MAIRKTGIDFGGLRPFGGGVPSSPQQFPTTPSYQPFGSGSVNVGGTTIEGGNLGDVQASVGMASQTPTGVLGDIPGRLAPALGAYGSAASNLLGIRPNLGRINLSTNFQGPEALRDALGGGIDYFGKLGITEGLQNINLQRQAQDRQLASALGRTPGNSPLLQVLQNQNLMRSQLAANPLVSQAQKGTAERAEQMLNLQNQLVNLANQTRLQQGAYNQQAQLAELQARLGLLQPQQNLLELLTGLQGQARGVTGREVSVGGKNYG